MTLVELSVALVLAGGVMLAIGHVTNQMTRGAASIDQRSQSQTEVALAMLRMRSELEYANSITTLTSKKIVFRHPDVNGDGSVDTVTFEWTGTTGDPLNRSINGGTAEPILDKCRSFVVSAAAPVIRMVAGSRHDIRLEVYENTGNAVAKLLWSGPGGASKATIPTTRFFPAYTPVGTTPPNSTTGIGLLGEYYDNADFTNLKLVRVDSSIDFDWGSSSPNGALGSDTFSVRWTGHLRPQTTNDFTFYTVSDDGVRLWLDNRLLIDNWTIHSSTEDKGGTSGVTHVELHLESGTATSSVQLDGAVHLMNTPSYGG